MLWLKCLDKIKNENSIIINYKIADLNGEQRIVTKEQLKNAMINNQVGIVNLKLSIDNKIIDRSIAEQSALMKKLGLNKITEKDDIMYKKAMMLGVSPQVDEDGYVISWPDTEKIYITPNITFINTLSRLSNRTLIFSGNNNLRFGINEFYNKAIIYNPTLVTSVVNKEFIAETILFDFDNMDINIIDIIFKIFKNEVDTKYLDFNTVTKYKQYENILVSNKRLKCENVYDRVKQILKRQKTSNKLERRCYDLIVYLRLIYSVYSSFNNISILYETPVYIEEYREKFSIMHGTSNKYAYFINMFGAFTDKLIDTIEEKIKSGE